MVFIEFIDAEAPVDKVASTPEPVTAVSRRLRLALADSEAGAKEAVRR